MTCGSKGAVDVYIEPFVQARTVAIVGLTPVADALAQLAATLEYRVVRAVSQEELRDVDGAISVEELGARLAAMAPEARASLGVVVASQGHYDEPALELAVRARSPYIALVASRRRGEEVREALSPAGLAPGDVAAIHNPAGLDLGARHPGEVALSILAELVRQHPSPRAFATDVARRRRRPRSRSTRSAAWRSSSRPTPSRPTGTARRTTSAATAAAPASWPRSARSLYRTALTGRSWARAHCSQSSGRPRRGRPPRARRPCARRAPPPAGRRTAAPGSRRRRSPSAPA